MGSGRVWEGRRYGERKGAQRKERGEKKGGRGCLFRRVDKEKGKEWRPACPGEKGRLRVGRACLLKGQGTQVTEQASIIITVCSCGIFVFIEKA